jgi:membrane associated rhomboid family serine protease
MRTGRAGRDENRPGAAWALAVASWGRMRRVTDQELSHCYRHPDRETALHCSTCGRPICADCMTPTPVGQRCPECLGRTRVSRPRAVGGEPRATFALIAICVIAFLVVGGASGGLGGTIGGARFDQFALFGPSVASGEWWRLVTAIFLHVNLLHLLFNMYALYWLGPLLERRFGTLRYLALFLVAGLWGSAGALLVTPDAVTVGASGAIFGLMGALVVVLRRRGTRDLGGIGAVIAINLVFTFSFSGISIGGHIGGLIGGTLAAAVLEYGGVYKNRLGAAVWLGLLVLAAIGTTAAIVASHHAGAVVG